MQQQKSWSVLNLLSLILHITLSYLTQVKMINQQDVGQVSDQFPSLFTPAGFTFGIWGIIYAGLLLLCLYHLVKAYKRDPDHPANVDTRRMGPFFFLVNLATSAWLIVWTRGMVTESLALIAFQLVGLIAIHARLGLYNPLQNASSKLATQVPLSIWLGWISVATIANTSIYLVYKGWDGAGYPATTWMIVMTSVALLLALLMMIVRRNSYFGLVIAWAFFGIIRKLESLDQPGLDTIIKLCWTGIIIIVVVALIRMILNLRMQNSPGTFPIQDAPLK